MADKHIFSFLRGLEIIIELEQKGVICKETVPKGEWKNKKRYLDTLDFFFKSYKQKNIFNLEKKGCYRVLNREKLRHFFNMLYDQDEFESKASVLSRFFPHDYEKIYPTKTSEQTILYTNPLEDFSNHGFITHLNKAISTKSKVSIRYLSSTHKQQITFYEMIPLRIVFIEGNLYLATLEECEANNGFKFLRISNIQSVKPLAKGFHHTQRVQQAIEFTTHRIQTPFTSYLSETFEVHLRVSPCVAGYFKKKKFLASQKIMNENKDGDLILSFQVTQEMEIVPLIKKWIPHLSVIKPASLKESLKKEIQEHLNTF